jgi:tetratricopeptide (TPR) repeat protein
VHRDSIEWIPKAVFDTMDPAELQSGARRVFDQALGALAGWETFAPESPQPKAFFTRMLITRRDSLGVTSPQRLKAAAAEALAYAEAALSLRSDTATADLFEIANLQWASGKAEEAVDLARTAMIRHRTLPDSIRGPTPLFAANLFLASGQLEEALWIVRQHRGRRFVPDPSSGEVIGLAGAEPVVFALAVLGAGGVTGEPVLRELERLDSIWQAAGYSPHQEEVLRNSSTIRIATALAQDPAAYQTWEETADIDRHLWATLGLPLRSEISDQEYLHAVETPSNMIEDSPKAFLVALRARDSGARHIAQRIFSRLDSLPHGVNSFDSGWGLTALSSIYRAEILEERGEYEAAFRTLQKFVSIWREADSLGQLTVNRARARMHRIEARLGGEPPPGSE